MLGNLPSIGLPFSLTAVLAAARRDRDVANRGRFNLTARCTGNVRVTAGDDTVGGITGLMAGGGIAGTLAALPMPLGSLIEPLGPRAFAGPGGMPLTPASWAGAPPGAAKRPRTATVSKAALPAIHPREKIETGCAWLMDWESLADLSTGRNLQGGTEVPMVRGRLALTSACHERTFACGAAI